MEGNATEELHGVPYAFLTHHLHNSSPTQKPTLTSSLLNMETGGGHEEHQVLAHLDPSQGLHYIPFYYSQLHLPNTAIQIPDHNSSPNNTSNSNNSNNSDGAKVLHDDRRKKRMFSNRESARRSRMRKKQQIEALQHQVNHLQNMNHQLSQKIIYLLERNQQILHQNAQLKERVSSLQVTLSNVLVPLAHVEEANHIPNGLTVASSGAQCLSNRL